MNRTIGCRVKGKLSSRAFFAVVAIVAFVTGCSCEREKKEEVKEAPATPQEPAIPADVDQELFKLLEQAAVDCKVADARQRITCNGGEKNALALSFNKGERDRIAALPTLVYALKSEDEKLRALSAAVLYASFRTGLGPQAKKGAVKSEAASDFLKVTLALSDPLAMQAIPAATHASMLAGNAKELIAALSPEVPVQVRTMAYRYLMVYGRLDAFETIRTLGSDPGAAVVLSAIESPRNMREWTSEEQEAVCPWAVGFLDDTRPPVVGNAMAVLSNCAGKELDELLERLEQTLKEKQFSFIHSTALRDVCGAARTRREKGATDEQCDKVRRLQEKALKDADVKGRVRAMCLSSLAYNWPDEKTLAVARALKKDSDADVERTANQVITRLERTLSR